MKILEFKSLPYESTIECIVCVIFVNNLSLFGGPKWSILIFF